MPSFLPSGHRSFRIKCVNNLKEVALAIRLFEGDSDRFHFRHSTNVGGTMEFVGTGETFRHFQVMSNELKSPRILICPSDTRREAPIFTMLSNSNLSYFVGLDASDVEPTMFLSGDRNITNGFPIKNGLLELKTNQPVGWTAEMHNLHGNTGLADGSVQQVTSQGLRDLLNKTDAETTRLAMP